MLERRRGGLNINVPLIKQVAPSEKIETVSSCTFRIQAQPKRPANVADVANQSREHARNILRPPPPALGVDRLRVRADRVHVVAPQLVVHGLRERDLAPHLPPVVQGDLKTDPTV